MKILYLNPSGQIGGAETMLLNLMASLRAARPDWPLSLVTAQPGLLVERAKALDVAVSVVPFPPTVARFGDSGLGARAPLDRALLFARGLAAAASAVPYLRRLRRAVGGIAPDLIAANGFKMHLLGAWSRPAGIPLVWHLNDYVSTRPLMARLIRIHAGRASGAIAMSESVAADARAVCGAGSRVWCRYSGVDTERFSPAGARLDLDGLAGLAESPPGTVKVGLIGTFARWKGHAAFLEALSRLPRDLPWRGYIVGGALYQTEGSQYSRRDLESLAERFGVADRVGFTGFVDEPAAAMRALDIVVHASTQPEPFGLVIVEAMACGRAVIASDAGGAAEIVRDGVDAFGHAPGDTAQLADCIRRFAVSQRLRQTVGERARETAVSRFDRARVAANVIPVYLELASAAGERRGTLA